MKNVFLEKGGISCVWFEKMVLVVKGGLILVYIVMNLFVLKL